MNGEQIMPMHEPKETGKVPVKAKVKVTTVMVTTAELSAKHVEAYTADGRPINGEKLKTLLAKERTVLVAMDGKKLDPFHLQLYKDDTIVLVPPANTLNMGGAYGAYGGYGSPVTPPIVPEPKRPPMGHDKRTPD